MGNIINSDSICALILNYQSYEDTIKYIENLQQQENIDLKILIVDNCSPNGSYEILRNTFKDVSNVEVIKSEKNGGYAYGNNFGLRYLRGKNIDSIVISNNDIVIIDNNLLFNLITAYKSLKNVAFIAPAQNNENNKIYDHSAWKQHTFVKDIFMSFWIYRRFEKSYKYDFGISTIPIPVDILPGSFLFTNYDFFEKIGFFDEGTFLFLEEQILFEKIKKKYKQNYLIPFISYIHKSSTVIDSEISNINKYKILYQSLLYYTKKYRPHGVLKSKILWPFVQYSIFELLIINGFKKLFRNKL